EYDGVHKYIRITDIDEDSREFCPNPLSSPDEKPDKRYKLKAGDIVFARTGASVGKSYLYKEEDGDIYFAGFLIRFTINKANPFFVYTQTLLRPYDKWVKIMSMRSGQPGVNAEEFKTLNLSFPSLPEQQKIASFFTAIDRKIFQLKRKLTLLEQYKKGVMQKIFSQQIRFKDDNGKEFPKWEKMTGDALFETVSNKNHNSDLPILAITQEHGAIPRDMIDYYITVSEQSIESYKVVEKGDFIISLRSFQGGIEYSEYKGICSPAYIILRAIRRIDHRYFKYYFKTEEYITDLNRKLEGIRDGKMISFKYFSEIKINVPSLPEQSKIASFLSAIDDKINHTRKQIEKAGVWKKGLMQQMFV
ncbi:MAG: restriction endonuclease subunit S, partial [Candidatus Methanofastidiosa archaeon]|nr:restriction endonuclease subunit S [Candidatus Methanofastidiosa archaeon]